MLVDNQEKMPKTEYNLPDEYEKFFLDKIEKICTQLDGSHSYDIKNLEPCSTKHIYRCLDVLKGTLTKMVTLFLTQGLFIQYWKCHSQAFHKNIMNHFNMY